jgi:hypothetical protein
MNASKTVAVAAAFFGLSGVIIWQQVWVKRVEAESAGLREQFAQSIASVREEQEQVDKPQPRVGQRPDEERSAELLRLRGEVTVLRNQLAEAVKAGSAPKVAFKTGQLEPPVQPEARRKPDLAALDAHLTAQEQKLEAAKQKVAGLLAALSIPQDVSRMEAATGLGREDLKQYWSYFEAKKGLEEEERYAQILRMKVRFDHLDAGDYSGASPSQ